jgi:hypothetical protein
MTNAAAAPAKKDDVPATAPVTMNAKAGCYSPIAILAKSATSAVIA